MFIQTHLSGLLEDVSINKHLRLWFQHDGAAQQYSYLVRQ
jgi:hypothetical protein